jgi:maleate cis-trans isomerase
MKMLVSQTATGLERRSLLRGAVCAGLWAAAPVLAPFTGPASAASWRGLVGCIKPRARGSSLGEMIRLLPPGIDVVPVYVNLAEGSREELQGSYPAYEKNIAYLASERCDLISIEGAPPFMILGPDGEAKLLDGWKQKYKIDMFTSSQNQVNVLRAMKIRTILGITGSFGPDLNKSFAKYFEDSGINVIALEGIGATFQTVGDVSAEAIYTFIKKKFLQHPGADAVYILGSGLDALGVVAPLEQDLGIPVIQPIAARIWEIQRRLHVRQPIKGYGTLLENLPA